MNALTHPEPASHSMALPLREVVCHYCGCTMKTYARNTPTTGHKCDLCVKFYRGAPSRRLGLTKEMNARANLIDSRNDDSHREHSHGAFKEKNNEADAYRKTTGK